MIEKIAVTETFAARVLGARSRESHKGDYGYIGLIGGSLEYSGAVKLSNLAATAMRAGAGVTRLIVPEGIAHAVTPYLMESTLYALPDDGRGGVRYEEKSFDKAVAGLKAVGAGIGLGRGGDVIELVKGLLRKEGLRVLLDADALNAVAEEGSDVLKAKRGEVVLTPHLGEFARLTGLKISEIKDRPADLAAEYASAYGVTVLLKGATTYVTDGNRLFVNERGTPGMATAGSGDVLTGILTAALGYVSDVTEAAAFAAYVNGAAGELAAEREGVAGMIAGDTARNISRVLKKLEKKLRSQLGTD